MYKVTVEGSTTLWRRHANQLRVRSVILPTSNSSNHTNVNSPEAPPPPPTLRRSARIRKQRIPWSPSN